MRETANEKIGFSERERELVFGIVGVLPDSAAARVTREDGEILIIELPEATGSRLRILAFARRAVAELLSDAAREVKIEYLRRDLRRSARSRREYRYPRGLALRPSTFSSIRTEAERLTKRRKCAEASV